MESQEKSGGGWNNYWGFSGTNEGIGNATRAAKLIGIWIDTLPLTLIASWVAPLSPGTQAQVPCSDGGGAWFLLSFFLSFLFFSLLYLSFFADGPHRLPTCSLGSPCLLRWMVGGRGWKCLSFGFLRWACVLKKGATCYWSAGNFARQSYGKRQHLSRIGLKRCYSLTGDLLISPLAKKSYLSSLEGSTNNRHQCWDSICKVGHTCTYGTDRSIMGQLGCHVATLLALLWKFFDIVSIAPGRVGFFQTSYPNDRTIWIEISDNYRDVFQSLVDVGLWMMVKRLDQDVLMSVGTAPPVSVFELCGPSKPQTCIK